MKKLEINCDEALINDVTYAINKALDNDTDLLCALSSVAVVLCVICEAGSENINDFKRNLALIEKIQSDISESYFEKMTKAPVVAH